jgi:PAS domain S-box-containing protein
MVVVAVPLMVAHTIHTRSLLADGRVAAEERVRQAGELMANRADDWIESANAAFLSLADPVRRNWNDRSQLDSLLSVASSATNQRFVNFFVVDTLGRNRGSGRPTPDRDTLNYLARDYFRQALLTDGTVVGAPRRSFVLEDRAWVVIVARALREPDGRPFGVIASPVRIDTLADFVRVPAFEIAPLVTIIDTSGLVVARSESPERFVGRDVFTVAGRPMSLPTRTRVDTVPGVDGVRRLTASVMARRAPWLVSVGLPLDAFEAPLRRQQRANVLFSLYALLVAGAGALLVGGSVTNALTQLAADARRIADGWTDHRSRVTGPAEVETLRDAVHRMAENAERRNVALADSERRYRFLFESNPLPMWAWNADSMELLAVNEAMVEHYGYAREALLGQPITMLLDPSEHTRFGRRRLPFTEQRQHAGTWRHRTADGRVVEMEIITTSTSRLGTNSWLSIGIDVTARNEARRALARSEEQLRQSQKMEAVGAFAGGIAHDFNNLLTGIIGFSELALGELASNHPVRKDLVEVRGLAERGAALTRQILAVSRKQVLQPTTVNLNALVEDLGRLFERLVGEHIRIVSTRDATLRPVEADASQLEQVLLNLVANARDAMPAGGTLTIETRALHAAQATALGLAAHEWSVLIVKDTGVGMSPEVRQRIFEPFFTTKERGKGTGLGLALAYAMLQQVQGVITCDSTPGHGSAFHLYFPAQPEVDAQLSPAEVPAAPSGHGETILLAEDEDAVRTVTRAVLERAGYRVIAAADGPSAIEASRALAEPVDLLLTDVVMPGMHGRELATALQRERPGLRVLFASGYTDDAVLLRGVRVDEVPFLQKPYTPAQLLRKVRDALEAPPVVLPDLDAPGVSA